MVLPTPVPPETVITFPDENLEAAVREALNKPSGEITAGELAELTTLSAFRRGITELTGIEHCLNLTRLNLGDNLIIDVSPLAALTTLSVLDLGQGSIGGNKISDVSPLASLTNLTWLGLGGNQMTDISPLASLTSLTGLDLSQTGISDISPLASLTSLIFLDLAGNSGLGQGDSVDLRLNELDLTEGSEASENIKTLESRGVTVH